MKGKVKPHPVVVGLLGLILDQEVLGGGHSDPEVLATGPLGKQNSLARLDFPCQI